MHTLKAGLFGLLAFCFLAPVALALPSQQVEVVEPQGDPIVVFRGTFQASCGEISVTIVVDTESGEGSITWRGCGMSGTAMFGKKEGVKPPTDFTNIVLHPYDESTKPEDVEAFKKSPMYNNCLAALAQQMKERSAKKN